MRAIMMTLCLIVIVSSALVSLAAIGGSRLLLRNSAIPEQAIPIREGPMGVSEATPGDPYWFQQGAVGDSSTDYSDGASVMIRTVFDSLNNDAHSYWVGSILNDGAFAQVGYINGLTTTGRYYCCAWFYEFFPPKPQPGWDSSPPIIGPPGSAGPIGSWHTYSMNYNASAGAGVWSFYMDGVYLGSSPTSGQLYYLGSAATSSGTNPIAALSEVAQTTSSSDVIGPAEFKNFKYELNLNAFQLVPTGNVHIKLGATSDYALNPYSVAEIEKTQNDFLAGSDVPNTCTLSSPCGTDECGNSAPSVLWSAALALSCTGSSPYSFSFVDKEGSGVTPAWISLSDSTGREIFFTNYTSQTIPNPSGHWSLSQVSWHSTNVAIGQTVDMARTSQGFLTNVFSVTLAVVGYIYSLPVKNAPVIVYLPDSTNQTSGTDNNGEAVFTQLPPSNYTLHISVPYGIASSQVLDIAGPGSVVAKVFSLPELITIIVPPIFITILVAIIVVRKEHQRQVMVQAQVPMQPVPIALFCRSCGKPLSPTANFCTSCGTPVRMVVQ